MKYSIIHPEIILQDHVQYFWTLEANQDDFEKPIRTFVDDSTGILIEFPTGDKNSFPRRTMIYGQTTTPTINQNKNTFSTLGVLFQPYAIKELFGVNAYELTNQKIHLNEFFNNHFTEIIASKKTLSEKINLLTAHIAKGSTKAKFLDNIIRHCIFYIKQQNGMLTVRDLQLKFQISERQLERRFNEVIGVSPRHYLKITRFKQAVIALSQNPESNLTDLAFEFNFFDQSHFIKQVKELSGLLPKDLKRELTTPVANLIL